MGTFQKTGRWPWLDEKRITGMAKRFLKNKPLAIQWINNSFLSDALKDKYKKLLKILQRLFEAD